MKKAEGRPQTVESGRREIEMPHIHFLNVRIRHTFLCESYEAVRQIDGSNCIAQFGESLRIHSWSTTTIENVGTYRQSLNDFLALRLDELVGLSEVATVIIRTIVIGPFNMRIISVFVLHVDIVARHRRARKWSFIPVARRGR